MMLVGISEFSGVGFVFCSLSNHLLNKIFAGQII